MRWSDMDAYRHINNGAYLAYLEQARVAMFFDRHETFSSGTVIARHEIDYLLPVVYHPQPLRLELWIENVRWASFSVRYEVKPAPLVPGTYRNISGNTALAYGLVAGSQLAGLPLFLGSYPITPASDILHELAKHKRFGVRRSARFGIPWSAVIESTVRHVKVDLCAEETVAYDWERWLRKHVVERIPGASSDG